MNTRHFQRILALLAALLLICPLFAADGENALVITVHAAGHGDMIEIRAPNGDTSLIDCGSASSPSARQAVRALPARLRYFIASHPHEDHIGNCALAASRADIIVDGGLESPEHAQAELYALAARGKRFIFAEAGMSLDLGGGVRLEILSPARDFLRGTNSDPNNNSIVCMLRYGRFRMLFTGDIEMDGIETLLLRKPDLGCDVIKVPHHGSRGSLDMRFIKALGAKYAVVSAAPDDAREGHGLPHEDVVRAYRNAGTEVFVTGRHGKIQITAGDEEWTVESTVKPLS
ncbi:MAG: MBL fold metallo-hydrolase [Spirochaetota bacterium]|jgi:competence protein ComEC|nr:MBL fold metallo-hydrolase [Spirochaetota bacterium]